jgi:FlaA1/EpsC-like NDP-sugar epimerase
MKKSRVLVIGAGEAGIMIAREMKKNPRSVLEPVAFIDDDPAKQGRLLEQIPVAGTVEDIARLAESLKIDEIIIAVPSATGIQIRRIISFCRRLNVRFRIVPGLLEIIKGDAKYSQIRDVKEDDLLGRETVALKESFSYLEGSVVLITGAGGSIGSELCRQVIGYRARDIILLGHGENSIYIISQELREMTGIETRIHPIIADITDKKKIRRIFEIFRPNVVFHAAAHKHVPLMQDFPEEAVKNNIVGTRVVAESAAKFGAGKFILISSDKAVEPHNNMGLSKRIAEIFIQDLGKKKKTVYSAVRFGNVLGSRGSVVPLFKMQIKRGGPVTVTDATATRFFMSVREAAQLVIQAGALSKGGEIFVLDMGEEISIDELARNLITLSGLEVDKDIEIKYVGLRPGEKIYEKLVSGDEKLMPTDEERIFKVAAVKGNPAQVMKELKFLIRCAANNDAESLNERFQALKKLV